MRNIACLFFALVFPLLILAMPVSGHHVFADHPYSAVNQRAYRLHEVQSSYFDTYWILSTREVCYYNPQHPAKLDSLEMYIWDPAEQNWDKHSVVVYQLDAHGRTVQSWYYDYWEGNWDLRERAEFTYDGFHRLILERWFDCDSSPEVLRYREHYFYNNNQLSEFVSWEYDSWDQTIEYYKDVFSNDPQGRPVEVLGYYSPDSLNWELDYKEECIYNPNDTSTGQTFVEYFSELMYEYGYLYSSITPWMWDSFTESYWSSRAWEYESRDTYNWLTPGNRLNQVISDSWDGTWIHQDQDTYTYNNDGNLSWSIYWYYEAGNWMESGRNAYTWEIFTSTDDHSLPPVPGLSLKACPQPFVDNVGLLPASAKTGEVELSIYNLKGQLARQLRTLPGTAANWDGKDTTGKSCASGIYFVKARQNNAEHTIRIIKLQ